MSNAVVAYRAALQVRTREQLGQQWAETQNNLGNALVEQGFRIGGEAGQQLLSEAEAAYCAALQVRTREQLAQQWAETQNNLGYALQEQGIRTAGEARQQLLSEAINAFRQALEFRTFESLRFQWAQTQNNLAKTYVYLQDWAKAAQSYANVLKVYPDYEEAYQIANNLCHEVLFNFSEAFALNQKWLERHPDDPFALCVFAFQHFTTSHFAECEKRLTALLANSDIELPDKIVLRAIEIANLLALNKTKPIPSKLDTLFAAVASQPDTFKVGWTFNGTKHFISQNEKLAPYRAWLLQLFSALEKEGREAILAALREVREKFKAVAGK